MVRAVHLPFACQHQTPGRLGAKEMIGVLALLNLASETCAFILANGAPVLLSSFHCNLKPLEFILVVEIDFWGPKCAKLMDESQVTSLRFF